MPRLWNVGLIVKCDDTGYQLRWNDANASGSGHPSEYVDSSADITLYWRQQSWH